jgi:hypothetical protein
MKNYLNFMRLSAVILVVMHTNATGNCQALLNENFEYPMGTLLTSNGWNAHSSVGVNAVLVSSAGLVFAGYPSSEIGLSAVLANNGEDVNKTFNTVITGSVFCAFLAKVNSFENEYFLHLAGAPVGNNHKGRVFTSGTGSTYNFGLSKGSGIPLFTTGSLYNKGDVYLLVLKYTIVEGSSNDEVSLYVITGSVPSSEPVVATIGPLTDASQTDLTNVSSVALRQYSSVQNILVDGIRVATRWEDAVSELTADGYISEYNYPVLYPVPAKSELIVRNITDVYRIDIFDLSGRKIITLNTYNNEMVKIPVDKLPGGIYILRLNTSRGIRIMKFIKN